VSESPLISSSCWWEVVRSAGGWSRAGVRCVRCRRSGRFGRGAGRFRGARPGRARRAAPCVPCPVRFCSTIRAGNPVVERHPAACPRGNPLFSVFRARMVRHSSPEPRVPSLWWSGPAPPRPPVSLPPRVVEQPGPQIAPRLPRTAFHGRVVARRRSTTRSPHAVVERQHPHGCTPWRGPVRIMILWHVPRTMLSQCCVERPVAWIGAAGGVRERPLARGRVSASLRAAVPGVTSPGGERPRPESGDAGAARNSRIRENGPIVRDL